jgi:hypothetical protein
VESLSGAVKRASVYTMGPSANVERYRENFMVAVADVFEMETRDLIV